jgi:hypothetical protein
VDNSADFWITLRSDAAYAMGTQSVRWRVWIYDNGAWSGPYAWHQQTTQNGAVAGHTSWYAPGHVYGIFAETQWWHPTIGWYGAGEYTPAYQIRPGYLSAVYNGRYCAT